MALYRSAQLPNSSIFSQRKSSYLYRLVRPDFLIATEPNQISHTLLGKESLTEQDAVVCWQWWNQAPMFSEMILLDELQLHLNIAPK